MALGVDSHDRLGYFAQRTVAIPYRHFGKPVGPIFKGEESLTLEEGMTDP